MAKFNRNLLPQSAHGPVIYQNIYVPAPPPHELELPGNIPLYRPAEVAQILGVSAKAVREWIHLGRISYLKTPTGHYLIPRAVVQELLRVYVQSIKGDDPEEEEVEW